MRSTNTSSSPSRKPKSPIECVPPSRQYTHSVLVSSDVSVRISRADDVALRLGQRSTLILIVRPFLRVRINTEIDTAISHPFTGRDVKGPSHCIRRIIRSSRDVWTNLKFYMDAGIWGCCHLHILSNEIGFFLRPKPDAILSGFLILESYLLGTRGTVVSYFF